jgi:hypothetical protein
MFKDVLDIYNKHLPSILVLSITLVFPVTFFIQLVVVYVYESSTVLFPSIISLCLLIINFIVLFSPFSFLTHKDLSDETVSLKELYAVFFSYFFYLLLFSVIVYAISVFGSFLILMPTIIGFSIIFLLPVFVDETSMKNHFRKAWLTLKSENIAVLGDIVIISSVQILLWTILTYIIKDLENSFFFFLVLRALVNTFLYPLFYIYLARKYGQLHEDRKWGTF